MQILNQGETAVNLRRVFFILLDAATGAVKQTGKIDANFTGFVTKADGSTAGETGTFAELDAANAPGLYYYQAATAELDVLGPIVFTITCAACLDRTIEAYVGNTNVELSGDIATAITTAEGNIRGGTDTLDSLSDQLDDVALETTAQNIKDKTDNLPTDPADESLLEAAITAAEGNIRGGDSDDLQDISAQLDAAQTDLDTPAQYMADVSALALEASVRGHADAALTAYDPPTRTEATADKAAIIAEVDANETKIDAVALETTAQAILADTAAIDTRLPTDPADQSAVAAAITAAEGNIRGADSDDLKTLSTQLDVAQADLNAPAQYQADVSALALEATAQVIKIETDKIADIPSDVLEESVTVHKAVANSLASVLHLLKRRTLGKVIRDETSITIYDDDGSTVLAEIPVEDTQYGPPA